MENKKLVKILLKDMGELEELIAEMKANQRFDALEMEFVHTRAKGILQLLQLFESKNTADSAFTQAEPVQVDAIPNVTEIEPEQEPVLSDSKTDAEIPAEPAQVEEKTIDDDKENQEIHQTVSDIPDADVHEETEGPAELKGAESEEEEDDMLEAEELEKAEAVSRLGDSFLKGKSVNDLINDQNKLEFKLSNRPVSSIQTAIGINDRFLYIHELFDGNNQKFLETVKTLDSKQNIKEAVDYLRENFKWKRNETSLKFVNLVKRRFIHE